MVQNPGEIRDILFSKTIPVLVPTALIFNGEWRLCFKGAKKPNCEGDHSPPLSANVKNEDIQTYFPPSHLDGACKDYFTFYHAC